MKTNERVHEFNWEYDCKCEYKQESKYEFLCEFDSKKLISLENLLF